MNRIIFSTETRSSQRKKPPLTPPKEGEQTRRKAVRPYMPSLFPPFGGIKGGYTGLLHSVRNDAQPKLPSFGGAGGGLSGSSTPPQREQKHTFGTY